MHESVHDVARRIFCANVCMRLSDIGTVRALVGKVTKHLAFESLDLYKVPMIPLAISGVHFSSGWTVIIILIEDDDSGGCA